MGCGVSGLVSNFVSISVRFSGNHCRRCGSPVCLCLRLEGVLLLLACLCSSILFVISRTCSCSALRAGRESSRWWYTPLCPAVLVVRASAVADGHTTCEEDFLRSLLFLVCASSLSTHTQRYYMLLSCVLAFAVAFRVGVQGVCGNEAGRDGYLKEGSVGFEV